MSIAQQNATGIPGTQAWKNRFSAAMLTRWLLAVGGLTSLVTLVGIMVAPERTWPNLLIGAFFWIGLCLGGMFFLATQAVASGGWFTCFKRVPEAIASTLPYGAILMVVTLIGGMSFLYEWSHEEVLRLDPLLAGKVGWLNAPFFLTRAVAILGIWIIFMWIMRRISLGQDRDGGIAGNRRFTTVSALFLVVFAITFSIASFDWLMSLNAHWFSTLFAGYQFAGMFVSGLAFMTVVVIVLRRNGVLRGVVTDDHLQDLGKLLFAFSSFWAYLWFSQYMLIWYSNLPEEVIWYEHRHAGAWAVLSALNPLINWVAPFLILLSRAAKRNEALLLKVAGLLLVGHWLDLFVTVQPTLLPEAPVLGVWEIAPLVAIGCMFLLALRKTLSATNMTPSGDAYYEESLHHHQ
jgi:hypothetical protein